MLTEENIKQFLQSLGEDPQDKRLKETPKRVKTMINEIFKGYKEDNRKFLKKTFPNPNINKNSFVKQSKIPFYTVCEHHLLPFFGTVSIKYIPNKKIVGLSKLTRTVQSYASKLSLQERLTYDIAKAIKEELDAKKVIVKIKAQHLCVSMRGVKAKTTKTITKTKL